MKFNKETLSVEAFNILADIRTDMIENLCDLDWQGVKAILEDGEALASMGIHDQEVVEEAYDYVNQEIEAQ